MTRRLAWLAIVGLTTYAVIIGGAWSGIYSPFLRMVSMALAGMVLAAWFVLARRRPEWRPQSVLFPAILVALASLTVSTILSRYPRISLEYLGYAVVLATLYLLLVRLFANPFFRSRIPILAAFLFAVIASAFLMVVVFHWVEWWSLVGRLGVPPLRPDHEGLTYLNPSAVLTMVALLAVPTMAALPSTRAGGFLMFVVAFAVGAVAIASGSRAGWLALAVTSVVMGLAVLASSRARTELWTMARRTASTKVGQVSIAAVLVAAVTAAVSLGPAVIFRLTEGGESLRATYVVAALRMFFEAPIAGTGPGAWVIQRPLYTAAGEQDFYIPHAHNIEAQVVAELGLVGLVAGLVVAAALLALVRRAIGDASPERRRWGWLTAAGLVYLGLHQQLDFYANSPAVLAAIAIPVAYLDARALDTAEVGGVRRPHWRLSSPPALEGLGAGALAVAVAALLWQEVPASQMASSVDAANRGDWQAARANADAAVHADPAMDPYRFMAALSAAHLGDHHAAEAGFAQVTMRSDLPEAWLDLAAERQLLGDMAGASEALDRAIRLGVQRPAVAVPAGDLALRLGRGETARAMFAASIALTPSLAGDPWWAADPERAETFELAVEDAIAMARPWDRWQIPLAQGDVDRAKSLARAAGAGPEVTRLIDAWAGDAEAAGRQMAVCRDDPFDLTMVAWCARLSAQNGDVATATTWLRVSDLLIGGSAANGRQLRIATDDDRVVAAGNPALFWATFSYRRPGPSGLLVPSLVMLTLR